ncbi:transforming acidic coiled-coil-containing protein 1 isoform X2 [Leucoraja erinacea]|uniref:transforming acidic coiled-coil-containing protein 1 isoform X2 n=1 Tax=Leucoraja erinaceus TaxID=7782 RepID=UPI0024575296|nr:transforming acidic coiled-coil-containing protein 1 isoform X2 [Leucoraja erinacea]
MGGFHSQSQPKGGARPSPHRPSMAGTGVRSAEPSGQAAWECLGAGRCGGTKNPRPPALARTSLDRHCSVSPCCSAAGDSSSFSSDSDTNFETPVTDTPVPGALDLSESELSPKQTATGWRTEDKPLSLEAADVSRLECGETTLDAAAEDTACTADEAPDRGNSPRIEVRAAETRRDGDSPRCANSGPGEQGGGMTVPAGEEQAAEGVEDQGPGGTGERTKAAPPSLDLGGAGDGDAATPKPAYGFDPDNFDGARNPFTSGGCRLQDSPPGGGPVAAGTEGEAGAKGPALKLEFDFSEDKENAETCPPVVRKVGRKPGGRTGKKHRTSIPKPTAPVVKEPVCPSANLDDVPIPKRSYNLDSSQWDDPNFNPFGGNSALQSSPTGSYAFHPDRLDAVDPFKPSKSLPNEDSPLERGTEVTERGELEVPAEGEEDGEVEAKGKPRVITNACRVKKYESQSLVLDVCSQDDEPLEVSCGGHIGQRQGHATDEEKLASTTVVPKPGGAEGRSEQEDDTEYFECSNLPACPLKPELAAPTEGLSNSKALDHLEPHAIAGHMPVAEMSSSESILSFKTLLSEMEGTLGNELISLQADKTEVLSLIREEIIGKEIEVNEWKQKYEDSRQEVIEMRKIVSEYENTIAQMIDDEQKNKMASQTSMQQLMAEKDQALSDLNSVERSLSDLFRRYENMKGVLEGFKKNEEVLKKCAQDYLARVKQEEQRYQALKMHAEEKLDKANEEIAQVRSKAHAEGAAMQATLRKEQMKVDSMERTIQQKNQEIEELTKICDELISKLARMD